MISVAKTTKNLSGFTLIEIVVVMAIAAVVMGGAVGLMVFSAVGRDLRSASGEVELLAKRARTSAVLHQTPYAIEIRQGVARLLPLAEAGRDNKETVGGHRIGGQTETVNGGEHREYIFPNELNLFVKRWASDKWLETEKNTIHIWRFDPNGLCEPLSLRFVQEKSWLEDTFNPLTAAIRETQFEIR